MRHASTILASLSAALLLAGCGGGGDSGAGSLTGEIVADGSSTVFPIQEAVAEEFQAANPNVRVSVGISGSGGGFKRLCNGELDLADASRPIKDEERAACAAAGIELTELSVAWDGLSVVANPSNDFAQCLTVDDLQRIWQPNSTVTTWRDVRAEWPAEEIKLYGPGTDSGTFDYFTETVNGESGASRADYQASEDDNILVQGIAGDQYSLGYFGYAYVVENRDKLKLLEIDGGNGCVLPSEETISSGTYTPLSRPLYVYVKHAALERPEVAAYVEFMLRNAHELVPATGYHPLSAEEYEQELAEIQAAGGGER